MLLASITLNTNIPPIKATSIKEFNAYVDKYKAENEIILTRAGNISQKTVRCLSASKVWKRGNRMEFQYIDGIEQIRVIYAIYNDEQYSKNTNLSTDALKYFDGLMDLIPTDYIEPDVELFTCPENPNSAYYGYVNDRYTDITVDNCYSLDRNNSFMASMMEVYPQTKEHVEKYYKERLERNGAENYEEFKQYGSIFIGWLANPRYHRLHAWNKIISNSNMVVHNLRKEIEKTNEVLLVNTDAIKFIDKYDYAGNTDLGGFKYEYENVDMYIKGIKSYAYREGDKWIFKQAGRCNLDVLKPRSEWTIEEYKKIKEIKVSKIKIINNKLEEVFE